MKYNLNGRSKDFQIRIQPFPALLLRSALVFDRRRQFSQVTPAESEAVNLISIIKKIKTEINKLTLIMIIIKIVIDNDYHF